MSNSIISCTNLARSYTDGKATIDVLKDIEFEVNPGEMVAIVGTSGSGKSTLLHLLAGLDKPTVGTVAINGKNVSEMSEEEKCHVRNRYLGFIYQYHHLLPEFSALENVGIPLLIRGEEPKMIREKSENLLEQVGLQDRMKHRLNALSGGERQRVAIARALAPDPTCILADEPTGNLDPQNADRVLDLFFDLQKKCETSVILVTHNSSIAKRADRIMRILDGGLTEA